MVVFDAFLYLVQTAVQLDPGATCKAATDGGKGSKPKKSSREEQSHRLFPLPGLMTAIVTLPAVNDT